MQSPTLLHVQGCLFARSKAMGGNRSVHVEQFVRVCNKGLFTLASFRDGSLCPTKPFKIIVRRPDEVVDVLSRQKIRNGAPRVEAASRLWMRHDVHESLLTTGSDLPAERIEPADQRAVGVNGAALSAKENASPVFCTREVQALAVLREAGAKLRRADALVRRQACDLVRIHLD